MSDNGKEPAVCLDEEQVSALRDLEKTTKLTVHEMVKEGLDLYIKFRKNLAPHPAEPSTMLSPIIFEPPYRKPQDQ